ncbi:MAG: 16S rRNA (cytosine(967)-C(5))-methyltransferase RsmB, partial [Clostridia bacterium]|nr:16S rRNA (cytosine(967)-C(5))-methyltransferase RsmB [Clostridia bacterium]
LGITTISADVQNGAECRPDMPSADKIICDVPCSGLGVIAKKPDIRYKSPDEFEKLPTLSLKILETAATYLKSGGDLVFSTCTLSKYENERVVEKFLASHAEFSLRPFEVGELKSDGMLTLLPHVHRTDGFFIAKLHKN